MLLRLAFVLILAAAPDSVYAYYLTGIRLQELRAQKNMSPSLEGMLQVYVMGIVDSAYVFRKDERPFCIPEGISARQATEVACKHLTDNPEERRRRAGEITTTALLKAWPCESDGRETVRSP